MADPISVVVRRGGTVESVHRVHAVAVRTARSSRGAGDPGLVTFMRSSAKPLQALPLARAREDLDERGPRDRVRLAPRDDEQLEAVRALLAKAPATEDDLECGPSRRARGSPQLLGQARGDARPLPRERLAERGLPAARAPGASRRCWPRSPAAAGRLGRDRDGGRRLRRRHLRAAARADGARLRASRGLDGGAPVADAMRAHPGADPRRRARPTPPDAGAPGLDRRRAEPRGSSARRPGRASASRSRSRTATHRASGAPALGFSSTARSRAELAVRPGRVLNSRGRGCRES